MTSSWTLDSPLSRLTGVSWSAVAIPLSAGLLWAYLSSQKKGRGFPLPPGPKPLPLIGNILQIPVETPWKVYKEWEKQYGDVIFLEAMGQRILILNSLEAINELLITRAANYSNRGYSPVVELSGYDWSFGLMNYGSKWREHRGAFAQIFHHGKIQRFHPIMEEEMRVYLRRLLSAPQDFREHTEYLFGSIIMRISYGAEDFQYNKQLVDVAGNLARNFMEFMAPGRLLVNTFHALRFVPSWFPGAGWKTALYNMARVNEDITARPFLDTEKRHKLGITSIYPSVAGDLLEDLPDKSDPGYASRKEVAKFLAAGSYLGGADTTITSCFILMLTLAIHPEIQKKARAEIKSVVGPDRLPVLADKEHLPYLQAVVKENSRWHSMLPFGLPHVSDKDDVFRGYHIPGNTVILPNTWAIMHDPELFEDPYGFKPERYLKDGKLNDSVLNPSDVGAFGYGRRMCPGRHLSQDIMFLFAASMIASFDLQPPLDENGKRTHLEFKAHTSGLMVYPLDYKIDIIPHSRELEALLLAN